MFFQNEFGAAPMRYRRDAALRGVERLILTTRRLLVRTRAASSIIAFLGRSRTSRTWRRVQDATHAIPPVALTEPTSHSHAAAFGAEPSVTLVRMHPGPGRKRYISKAYKEKDYSQVWNSELCLLSVPSFVSDVR